MPTSRPKAIAITSRKGNPCLKLTGTVGIAQARSLHDAASQLLAGKRRVTVDAKHAEHLDTSALQILVALKAGLERQGASLRLVGVSDGVARYLALSGLDRALIEGRDAASATEPPHAARG